MGARRGSRAKADRFYSVDQDSSLDARLFRAPPTSVLKKGASVQIHPLLEETLMTCVDSKEAVVMSDAEFNAYDLLCIKDFATSPATKTLVITMGKGLKLKKETGLTVKDVLRAVGKMWGEPAPGYSQYGFSSRGFTWRDTLGDHNGWTGWERAKVKKDGEVTIKPCPFDS